MRLFLMIIAVFALIGCEKKPDPRFATPKAAAQTLFQAMYDNDVATAKSCVVSGTGQTEMVEGMAKTMTAMRGTINAAYKRYGDEFKQLAGESLDITKIDPKALEGSSESVDGDSAVIVLAGGKTTLRLVRAEKVWKVDMIQSFMPKGSPPDSLMLGLMNTMFAAVAKAGDQTTAEIEAGQYPNARSAVLALEGNMKKALAEERERAVKQFAPR